MIPPEPEEIVTCDVMPRIPPRTPQPIAYEPPTAPRATPGAVLIDRFPDGGVTITIVPEMPGGAVPQQRLEKIMKFPIPGAMMLFVAVVIFALLGGLKPTLAQRPAVLALIAVAVVVGLSQLWLVLRAAR